MHGGDDRYAQLAGFYDRFIGDATYRRLGGLFDQLVGETNAGVSLLDIGCGTGWLLARARVAGCRVTGVDVSPAMVDMARRRCPDAELVCGSVMSLRGRSWTLLTATHDVFNHLARAEGLDRTFTLVYDLLQPGGTGLIDAVSSHDILHHWVGCRHEYSDGETMRCEVTHTVLPGSPPVGVMRRAWWRREGEAWMALGEEREEVVGIAPEALEAAAKAAGLAITLFDWDCDGPPTERTSRVGAWLHRL